MSEELDKLIESLRKAQKIIWAVDRILREKGIDSMLGYCEDYTSITIKEIKKAIEKAEGKD